MPSSQHVKIFNQLSLIVAFVWTVLTYGFFLYNKNNEEMHIHENIKKQAELTAKRVVQLITWEGIKNTNETKNGITLKSNISIKNLLIEMAKEEGATLVIEGKFSENKLKNIDKEKKEIIKESQKTKKAVFTSHHKNEKTFFYILPMLADKSCIKCHIHSDKKVGDILGNVNITKEMKPLIDVNPKTYWSLIIIYTLTWLVGLGISCWIRKRSKKYFDEKTQNFENSIYSFVDMMERRDRYTAGHSERVADYSLRIAKRLGLNEDDQNFIHKAGMLHDIGKIEIPDALLLKPDALTDEEYTLIKNHSKVGYELLSRKPFLDLAPIVLNHHERFDGKGYPNGLKGDEIPLFSQIISVADVFDAVTTSRAYRKAMSREKAIEIIQKESGKAFNPKIVEIAINMFKVVKLADDMSQMPSSAKDLRFSYYFRDSLTGFYSINYLKHLLSNRENNKIFSAHHINILNFTSYNKKYGWKNGDNFLQNLADKIHNSYENITIIRVFGDNFLILGMSEKINFEKSTIEILTKNVNLEVELKEVNLTDENIDTFDKLEDIILSSKKS